MLLELKHSCIYGPVNSRRLGPSLGLNILPGGKKTCSFDCVYCQYGWSDYSWMENPASVSWPSPETLGRELRAALDSRPEPPDYITFSGNGEPTAHPAFPEMVDLVTGIRDEAAPRSKTAVLSNSAHVGSEEVRLALSRLDHRIMKLDCGDEGTFTRFNRPAKGLTLDEIEEGLHSLENITIQSLFAGGNSGNLNQGNLDAWKDRIKKIGPKNVQIYSLDRGVPDSSLMKAALGSLELIRKMLEEIRITGHVFSRG